MCKESGRRCHTVIAPSSHSRDQQGNQALAAVNRAMAGSGRLTSAVGTLELARNLLVLIEQRSNRAVRRQRGQRMAVHARGEQRDWRSQCWLDFGLGTPDIP
jgi:hypothetical protein